MTAPLVWLLVAKLVTGTVLVDKLSAYKDESSCRAEIARLDSMLGAHMPLDCEGLPVDQD